MSVINAANTVVAHQHNEDFTRSPLFRKFQPFFVGGASGCIAITCMQPIDMLKTRLQLYGEGSKSGVRPSALSLARDIVSKGRVFDLYHGLSASLLRQVVYGTGRIGFFFTFEDMFKERARRNGTRYGFMQRTLASFCAGGLSAFIGNPVEVALIRMQSDGLKPVAQRAHYRSVFDALARILKTEGIRALWTGANPTIARAISTNFGQLTFFSETKHQLRMRTNLSERSQSVIASSVGGFFAAFFSLPFDFVKTRLQRQDKIAGKPAMYRGVLHCIVKVAREEGPLRFYRGFGTYVVRIAPFSVLVLTIADQFNAWLK